MTLLSDLFAGGGVGNIIEDTTPQLGGNLDMNGHNIGGNTEAQLDDAVAKKHAANGDTDLDSTFEATFVKKADTVNVLSDITSSGADIEDAVTKKHTQSHTVASHSDTTATGTQLNTLVGGGETNLHSHAGGGGLSNVVEDTTPQLGGNLDMNGKSIGGNTEAQLDDAVSKKHAATLLGTKTIDETDIGDEKVITYNSTSGNLEYESGGSVPSGSQGDMLYRNSSGWQSYGGTYNIKAYGAIGNGSTDDTTAINAALTAAGTAGGGVVFVPEGTYIISDDIQIPSKCSLIGQGAGSIIKWKNNIATDYTVCIRNSNHSGGNSKITIKNLALDGNSANNTKKLFGIWLKNVTGGIISDIWGYNSSCWTIRINECDEIKASNLDIRNLDVTTADAVHFLASTNCTLGDSYLESLGDDCLAISSADANSCHNIVCNNLVIKCATDKRSIWVGAEDGATAITHDILLGNITILAGGKIVIAGKSNYLTTNIRLNNINSGSCNDAMGALYGYYTDRLSITDCAFSKAQRKGIIWQYVENSIIDSCRFYGNSQLTDNTYEHINLDYSSYNTISNNMFRHGWGAKRASYGIILNVNSDANMIHGNNLFCSGKTGDISDNGASNRKRDNMANAGGWCTDV